LIIISETNVWVNDRTIYLSGNVNDESAGEINSELIKLIEADNKEDNEKKNYKRKPIKFYINSNGGILDDMWSISDIMQNSQTPIYTYCTGKAYSAGFWLLISGHKRFISPHAFICIHTLSSWTEGKYQTMLEDVRHSAELQKELENYTINKTKITQERLNEIREKKLDWFITAQECLDLGIADDWISNESKYFDYN
jgi:ATP-dependent Clp protease protease subunit